MISSNSTKARPRPPGVVVGCRADGGLGGAGREAPERGHGGHTAGPQPPVIIVGRFALVVLNVNTY